MRRSSIGGRNLLKSNFQVENRIFLKKFPGSHGRTSWFEKARK